jgi:molybdopterin-synthase adenylyltransferase
MHATIMPKLQPTVIVVPLEDSRLAIHRGTRQSAGNVIMEDPGTWRFAAIREMNGRSTTKDIARALGNGSSGLHISEIEDLISDLTQLGVVADASQFSTDGLRPDEVERYSRNLNGWAALSNDDRTAAQLQKQLAAGRVLILGAGGLGSVAAQALAMAGCENIALVDFDKIDLSNLNRQLYTTHEVGMNKVDALRARLEATNPAVHVTTMNSRLTSAEHVCEVVAMHQPDIVIAAIDRPVIANDRWVSDACFALGVPCVCNSVSAGTGMVWSKVPGKTGCFNCDELWAQQSNPDHYAVRRYREAHDLIPATSAFSFGAMVVGAMIASEVVRHLVGWRMTTAGRLVTMDFATLQTHITDKPQHPNCCVCRSSNGGRPC